MNSLSFSYFLNTSSAHFQGVLHGVAAYQRSLMLLPGAFFLALLVVLGLKETFGKRIEDRS